MQATARNVARFGTTGRIADSAQLRGLRTLTENLHGYFRPISALSADGRFFVTQGRQPFDLVVWDVAAEKELSVVRPRHAPTAGLTFAAFADPDRLLATGIGSPIQILQVGAQSSSWFRRFPRTNEYDRSSLAISPGGGYVAVFDKAKQMLRFYDARTGERAGEIVLPPFQPLGPMNCECVAFSPDGREVAALFFYNGHSHLGCWDLRDGHLQSRIDFGGSLRAILASRFAYLYAPLEWFPNGKRWLVYGEGIVDRAAGKLMWKIPDELNRMRYGIRRVVSDDCVLSVMHEKDGLVLGSLTLPMAHIDRAANSAREDVDAKTEN